MAAKTVWLLWSGMLEGAHIVGAFSTEELANKWAEKHHTPQPDVYPVILDKGIDLVRSYTHGC